MHVGEVLKSEPALPDNVSMHFYFTPHGEATNAPKMQGLISESDVFAPEIFNWSPDQQRDYTRISKGDYKTYISWRDHLPEGSYARLQIQSLYGKRLPVILFDVEEGSPLIDRVHDSLNKTLAETFRHNFEDTLEATRDMFTGTIGPTSREREAYMIANLASRTSSLVRQHPKLSKKSDVSVLVTLGSAHTNVYHQMRKMHPDPRRVTREFNKPEIYPYFIRCMRAAQFSKDLTDEMLAGAFASQITNLALDLQDSPLQFNSLFERDDRITRVIGRLTIDDVRQLHSELSEELAAEKGLGLKYPIMSIIMQSLAQA